MHVRLLYITAEMPFGTGEAFFIPEVKEIIRRGHDVLIVPRSASAGVFNGAAEGLRDVSIEAPVFSLGILVSAIAEAARSPLRSARSIAGVLLCSSPRALFRNLMVLPKALWLARLGRQWNADHIHAHWASTMATMAMVAGEVADIPWSFTAHRGDIVSNNLLARKAKKGSFVRFISQSGMALARSRGVRECGDKLQVIHMGAALPSAAPREVAAENTNHILCAANLIPVKGHRYLLEAVHRLKQRGVHCRLTVAGSGPLLTDLQKACELLAIEDCVSFVGQLPHDDLLRLYQDGKVAVVVLPSVDLGGGLHEGIPVTLIEAMASGVPVVATRTGGIPELLGDGAGVMVPGGDSAALADAIEEVLHDTDLRNEIAKRGKCRVESEFATESVVARLLDRIEATLPAQRRTPGHCPVEAGVRP